MERFWAYAPYHWWIQPAKEEAEAKEAEAFVNECLMDLGCFEHYWYLPSELLEELEK